MFQRVGYDVLWNYTIFTFPLGRSTFHGGNDLPVSPVFSFDFDTGSELWFIRRSRTSSSACTRLSSKNTVITVNIDVLFQRPVNISVTNMAKWRFVAYRKSGWVLAGHCRSASIRVEGTYTVRLPCSNTVTELSIGSLATRTQWKQNTFLHAHISNRLIFQRRRRFLFLFYFS